MACYDKTEDFLVILHPMLHLTHSYIVRQMINDSDSERRRAFQAGNHEVVIKKYPTLIAWSGFALNESISNSTRSPDLRTNHCAFRAPENFRRTRRLRSTLDGLFECLNRIADL